MRTDPSRHGILQPISGCGEAQVGMDVAEGCAATCIHCTGGLAGDKYGQPTAPVVEREAGAKVSRELEALAGVGRRPARIRLGVVSDPFLPDPKVLAATCEVLAAAFDGGVPVEIHTRSMVPEAVLGLLKTHPHMVHVVMGVMGMRDSAARVYEPSLPPPLGRLKGLRPLMAAGIPVTVRVEPLIPLVNDTEADLEELFSAVAKVGVKRVELAYLQLTPDTAKSLSRGLPRMHREMLKGLFGQEPWRESPQGTRKLLPRMLRDAGYERALESARRVGLYASVCATVDPDVKGARVCHRALGDAPVVPAARKSTPPVAATQQLGLFKG
ncbi:MAG: hypothetical protein HY904_25430 [Deltaproteobacteria bacterium]|nr:hypothetical protein [Deltaproteobacteria bacterium]